MSGKPQPLEGRFWNRIVKTEFGCWHWTGWKLPKGYGGINYLGKKIYTHRLSWILTKGPIPDNLHVLHRCDNPSCINPDHLFLGTNLDNIRDMESKGRRRNADVRGENNPRAILTTDEVLKMRMLYARGWTARSISQGLCVPLKPTEKVVNGKSWKHLL